METPYSRSEQGLLASVVIKRRRTAARLSVLMTALRMSVRWLDETRILSEQKTANRRQSVSRLSVLMTALQSTVKRLHVTSLLWVRRRPAERWYTDVVAKTEATVAA